MVQIQINNMMAIIQILVCSFLCALVTGRPCVLCDVPMHQTNGQVRGNLKLHYNDGSTFRMNYDRSILDCTKTDLPDKVITGVEVTSAAFILHNNVKWRGMAKPVSWGNYSASEIGFPNMKVRSIKQPGCP